MGPFEEENFHGNENENGQGKLYAHFRANPWLGILLIALLGIAGISLAYGVHEKSVANQLQVQAASTANSMNQLQAQVNTLTAKLNAMTSAQTAAPATASAESESAAPSTEEEAATPVNPAPETTTAANIAPAPAAPAKPAHAKRPAAKRHVTVDKRYAQLQNELNEQQKELKETQDAIAKNRADLEGTINSTRDELNGSIARTHDELVALEKKGERSYFEFDLSKSKQFQRCGPLTLSLRKADTKHKNYDLAMIVDDNELTKKKVNLYEPIWIHTESGEQPVQIVVNRIGKDLVHGYVSAPKYKPSELAALGSASTATPASASTQPAAQAQVQPQSQTQR